MRHLIILLFVVVAFLSCDVMKQSSKSKGEASGIEELESWRKRKGDTVSFEVPNVTFRDTTIYRVNREGTTLRTVYNESGQISNIDCFASAIEEMTKQNRQFYEQWKEKSKEKTEEFDSTAFLYAAISFAVVMIIGLVFIFILLSRNSQAISKIANNLK